MRSGLALCVACLAATSFAEEPLKLVSFLAETAIESASNESANNESANNESANETTPEPPTTTTLPPDQTGTIIVLVCIGIVLVAAAVFYRVMSREPEDDSTEVELTEQ